MCSGVVWVCFCMGLCADSCRFISPSTTVLWSSSFTSPGSHREVSVQVLEQVPFACPEPAWQRIKLSLQLSDSVLINWNENPAQRLEHWEGSKISAPPITVLFPVACKITIYCIDHFKSDFLRTYFFQEVLIPLILVAKAICFAFFRDILAI